MFSGRQWLRRLMQIAPGKTAPRRLEVEEFEGRCLLNSAPVVIDQGVFSVRRGLSGDEMALASGASDADGDILSYEIVTYPSHGMAAVGTDGIGTFAADWDYVGPDSFTYRAFDGQAYSNTATVSIDIRGIIAGGSNAILVGTENEAITGTLASFSFYPPSTDPASFGASILWGDGTSSGGTVVGDGTGAFHVTSAHNYLEEGVYPVALQVQGLDDTAIAVTLAAAFATHDHTRVEVLTNGTVTGGGSVTHPVAGDYDHQYDIAGDAAFSFEVQSNLRADLYTDASRHRAGSITGSASASGESGLNPFTMLGGAGWGTGTGSLSKTNAGNDFGGTWNRSANTLGTLTLGGNYEYLDGLGMFSRQAEYDGTGEVVESGTRLDGTTYNRTAPITISSDYDHSGDYQSGDYTGWWQDSSSSVDGVETGVRQSYTFTQSFTEMESVQGTREGNVYSGAFTLDEDGSSSSSSTETGTNAVGGYQRIAAGSTQYTLDAIGNALTRTLRLDRSGHDSESMNEDGNLSTAGYGVSYYPERDWEDHLEHNGFSGDYTRNYSSTEEADWADGVVNQSLQMLRWGSDTVCVTGTESGNAVAGQLSRSSATVGSKTGGYFVTNLPLSGSGTLSGSWLSSSS